MGVIDLELVLEDLDFKDREYLDQDDFDLEDFDCKSLREDLDREGIENFGP